MTINIVKRGLITHTGCEWDFAEIKLKLWALLEAVSCAYDTVALKPSLFTIHALKAN